ncbi:nuclear transport factor 2-like protein [Mucilaginibacter boryungensis]|uniref:SnoaL-like protein n=1 Tax=Mucilaginibacter boryungensis TaxID=768480 RepID=A0ABR9XIQ0_9SPHI|nr:hypothetical protein [Mucilaginibacter boryungensis]MBE9667263.1 hypothetical protein [Mucilaginibacter boryungensis]
MKKSYLLLLMPLLLAACTPKASSDTATKAAADVPNYPYKIKHPDYWMMDTSHANTMTALNALKAFENMDTTGLKKAFADTLEFNYDGGKFKGPIAQFIKMTSEMATSMKGLKIDMKDWESVVSTDKKEEWVTLWYVQKWTDAKGKADSISLVNDLQLKGGRIVKLDEYDMHFKMPQK